MAVSKVDAANQIENQLPQANIAGNVNFRNILINGDMSIAQRGTSVTGITSGLTYHTIDRYQLQLSSLGTWTQSQSTDVPSGQGFSKSLKMDCTTADASPASGDYMIIITKFEGQNLQYLKKGTSSAESLTLSFWVKSNKTGTLQVNARDNDNTRQIGATYTISSADTWEKKTITFSGDTTGAFDNDNNNSLSLEWWLASGSDFNSGSVPTSWEASTNADRNAGSTINLADSTDNEWYITGVQLEAGTTASDFEFLPFDTQLQRCKRYYQKTFAYATTPAQNISANNLIVTVVAGGSSDSRGGYFFPVEMRAAPTITTFNPFATNSSFRKPNSSTDVAVSPEIFSNFINFGTSGSGTTALHGHFTVDAEL